MFNTHPEKTSHSTVMNILREIPTRQLYFLEFATRSPYAQIRPVPNDFFVGTENVSSIKSSMESELVISAKLLISVLCSSMS